MKPSDILFELLEARELLQWERNKSTPSKIYIKSAEHEVERLAELFDAIMDKE